MGSFVDYSYGRVGGGNASHLDKVKEAGFDGIGRYVSFDGYPKNLSKQEYDYARSIDLSVITVWETTANMMLRGGPGGKYDSYHANKQLDAIGFDGEDLYYACDTDVNRSHFGTLEEYLASCDGRNANVYGEYDVIEFFIGEIGLCQLGWQCAAWSLNGNGSGGSIQGRRVSRHACAYQRLGYVLYDTCDTNDILKPYYGQVGSDHVHTNPIPIDNPNVLVIPTNRNEEQATVYAYKFDNHDNIWVTDLKANQDGHMEQWYRPVGSTDEVSAMIKSGAIGGVRLLGVGEDKGGSENYDAAYEHAKEHKRVINPI